MTVFLLPFFFREKTFFICIHLENSNSSCTFAMLYKYLAIFLMRI
jgi:hypothetical protein